MDADPHAYAIYKWKHWRGQAAERTEQIAELRRALGRKQRTLDAEVANAARYHDALQRIAQHPALQGGVSEHVAVRIAQEAMNDGC